MRRPILVALVGVVLVGATLVASTIRPAHAYSPRPINPCNQATFRNASEAEKSMLRLFRHIIVGGCRKHHH